MATDTDRFAASFRALMSEHPKHMYVYLYCFAFTMLSILDEATALLGWTERDLFVELLASSAIFAGVLQYGERRREEKRRAARLAGD